MLNKTKTKYFLKIKSANGTEMTFDKATFTKQSFTTIMELVTFPITFSILIIQEIPLKELEDGSIEIQETKIEIPLQGEEE